MIISNHHFPRNAVFIATSISVGGMERMMGSVARRLGAAGYAIDLWLAPGSEAERVVAWFGGRGVSARVSNSVPGVHQSRSWKQVARFSRFIAAQKAGVVNLHYGVGHISLKDVLAVRLAGRRCVATVHAAPGWGPNDEASQRATRRAALLCDRVIVHSCATRRYLLEAGVPVSRIVCILCGVEPPARTPTRAAARAALGLPPNAFVVSCAARLVLEKGVDTLLEAMAQFPSPFAPLLLIAGDGPESAALRAMGSALLGDRVRFLGHTPDLSDVYAASDLFVLPSHMEGFGLVYVEAAQHGVPSIGTNVGAIPEVILEGETGLLVPPRDAGALARAIRTLADDPERMAAMGRAAQRRAASDFSMGRMAEEYRRVLLGDALERRNDAAHQHCDAVLQR